MKLVLALNKEGLYRRIINRLYEEELKVPNNSRRSYLPYAVVYKKICGAFCLPKEELRVILQQLEDFGFIERVGFIGIRLNYEVKQ